eukprot:2223591-Karenia_brevis.AAC.2
MQGHDPMPKLNGSLKKQTRATQRQQLGKLCNLRVLPSTVKRYQWCVGKFLAWLAERGVSCAENESDLDAQVCAYIEFLWGSGEERNTASSTISGVQHAL